MKCLVTKHYSEPPGHHSNDRWATLRYDGSLMLMMRLFIVSHDGLWDL